jgi:YidC/Oxa1 family membrane protein insertase
MMDWRTILAVAISVVLIIAVPMLVPVIFPGDKVAVATSTPAPAAASSSAAPPASTTSTTATAPPASASTSAAATTVPAAGTGSVVADPAGAVLPATQPARVVRETDTLILTFESNGADVSSIQLKKYRNTDGSPVELVLAGASAERPFALAFGDYLAAPVAGPFILREYAEGARRMIEFSKALLSATGAPFTLKKTYVVMDGEYLVELRVAIESATNDAPALGAGGLGYTLLVGPQIGPAFKKLDGRQDSRNYVYYALNAKGSLDRKKEIATGNKTKTLESPVTWAGVIGKYFTVIAVPPGDQAKLVLDTRVLVPGTIRSALAFSRPALRAARTEDVWRFYLGPMKAELMEPYNAAEKNGFGISGLKIDQAIDKPGILGPIIWLLRQLMELFVKVIPNWGVSIILVTLVTKIVFLPLTFKSSDSMARMASLNPKIAEIRAKYKDKPERMNQEMAVLYKKEKVNPLSGCLPLLLQIPIFFSLYNLFNSHFELRGAMFIPGWIPDLSVAESIYNLPFTIPLIGIDAIRLLPLIMLGTQILSTKFTQPPSAEGASGAQMKLLNYAMPVVFLFMLYNMPAGLTLYWTVQNVLSVVQQVYINRMRKRKAAVPVAAS